MNGKLMSMNFSDDPSLSSPAPESAEDCESCADCDVGSLENTQLLMDEIVDTTEYIHGEEDCKAFINVLHECGIQTAEQFVDAFCVEYEGIVDSDEFVVIAFKGNTYFFRRLCGVPRSGSKNSQL